LITQLDSAERVQTRLHQRRVRIHITACSALDHLQNSVKAWARESLRLQLLSSWRAVHCEHRCEASCGGVIEDERAWELCPLAHSLLQCVPQFNGTK